RMCGIVGYAGLGPAETLAGQASTVEDGASDRPLEVVLEGLRRLEYRGYDSAGVALVGPGSQTVVSAKKAGKLANLLAELAERPLPAATAAVGHTRCATHG